jgi:transposase
MPRPLHGGGDRWDGATSITTLSLTSESLRGWVRQAEIDGGQRSGVTTTEQQRIAELEREVRELRRTGEILRTASAFFAAELDGRRPR